MSRFGFIGTGHMGSMLAEAVGKNFPPSEILLSNRTRAKAEALAQKLGCRAADNAAAAKGIYEIGQKGQTVILYVHEIDTSMVLNLSSAMRGRVSVADFGRKNISVKIAENQMPLDTLREIFGYLMG